MRLSNRTEYALLALAYLARQKPDSYVHGEDISRFQGIPMRFLQQILYSLKQAHFVKSVKGKSGGYALARDPSEISLAEVVRLFDGPLAATRSVSKFFYESTPITKEKKIITLLQELRDLVSKKLENTSIADIL